MIKKYEFTVMVATFKFKKLTAVLDKITLSTIYLLSLGPQSQMLTK